MAHYKTTLSDGRTVQFDHPRADLSKEEVQGVIDENLGQAPGFQGSPVSGSTEGPDWQGVISNAAKEALMFPETKTFKMASDPVAQAEALPVLGGLAGGASPIPGGTTLGTVVGRQLSNLALKAYGRPDLVPSGAQQIAEGGLSALGDIGAIPFMKKAYFGKQIGTAEAAANLGAVIKEAPPSGMRTAVKFIQNLKDQPFTPEEAKSLKPAVDTIFQKGWLRGTQYEPDAVAVSQAIQKSLNEIPGRAAASAGMARAMTIPRGINQLYSKIPPSVRRGLGYGTGVGLAGGTAVELIRKMFGSK